MYRRGANNFFGELSVAMIDRNKNFSSQVLITKQREISNNDFRMNRVWVGVQFRLFSFTNNQHLTDQTIQLSLHLFKTEILLARSVILTLCFHRKCFPAEYDRALQCIDVVGGRCVWYILYHTDDIKNCRPRYWLSKGGFSSPTF